MFKPSILIVVILLCQIDLHAAENRYSNYVSGNSLQKNSVQFLNFIDENFYSHEGDQKKLDVKKLRYMQQELRAKHKQLLDSYKQSIKIEFINKRYFT